MDFRFEYFNISFQVEGGLRGQPRNKTNKAGLSNLRAACGLRGNFVRPAKSYASIYNDLFAEFLK